MRGREQKTQPLKQMKSSRTIAQQLTREPQPRRWASLLAVFLFAVGCSKDETVGGRYYLEKIGALQISSSTNHLDENFYVPPEFDNAILGLSVQGSHKLPASNQMSLVTAVASLKFTLELFHEDASESFYRAEILVRSNTVLFPLWKPDLGYLLTGIEPFPYPDAGEQRAVVAGSYRQATNVFPLANGRPLPGVSYRVRVSVDQPVALSNRFQLWLYSYGPEKERSQIP
jgi:hypothetical protein